MKCISEWERMITGNLYNPSSKEIDVLHTRGMRRCDRFNRIALWRKKAKQNALETLIPSVKGNNLSVFAPFSANTA